MAEVRVMLISILIYLSEPTLAQQRDLLFSNETPLGIGLVFSIKEVAKTKQDSTYLPNLLYYKNPAGQQDSIKMALKSRGNFRLQTCYYPPLWIKLDKKAGKGTLFEGNRKLKLVLPCRQELHSNALIVREYLCYKLYEIISPYAFKSRLINIEFTEIRKKKPNHYKLKGILVEDLENVAKRHNAKAREEVKISPLSIQDTGAIRFSLFQYMISNTDLSMAYQHNTKLLQLREGSYISVPYDFDMSGLVDAPYAVVSQVNGMELDMETVRDRLYRGWCRSPAVTEFVRNEFLGNEAALLSAIEIAKDELSEKEIREIRLYLKEFFDVIKSDYLFKTRISGVCRIPE